MLCNYTRANTNTNALIALPSNLLIPRTVSETYVKFQQFQVSRFDMIALQVKILNASKAFSLLTDSSNKVTELHTNQFLVTGLSGKDKSPQAVDDMCINL